MNPPPPKVAVLDYGSGNLRSAQRALERVGAVVTVTADLAVCSAVDGLVVPGVGAFAACASALETIGAGAMITSRAAAGAPVLGICVGMQVLFDSGQEHGISAKGLSVLPGTVRRLHAERLPHMGWNTVQAPPSSTLFAGLDSAARYYFVHSYAACDDDQALSNIADSVIYTEHGKRFVAAVEHEAVAATQFHPEKSGDAGMTVLQNWVRSLR
ncbi:MAG: imidazole glycerol phosphate synthase subunit HisH [Acidimicrobiales bacterium]|nr:MAG: imidazole glycerol phosphate synthase subunit HisH [Acidimicrobiales bacterium]